MAESPFRLSEQVELGWAICSCLQNSRKVSVETGIISIPSACAGLERFSGAY
jgi:hypothetical protein